MLGGPRPASLSLLAGVLLVLSFPRFGHPAFAWIAVVPLLVALLGDRGRLPRPGAASLRALGLGFACGLTYFVGTVYWTSSVMRQYGDIGLPVAIALMVLLAAYLALYPALFAIVVHRIGVRFGTTRALWFAPAVWVATELARGYLFSGFPWVLLGYSQARVLPVVQLASVFGIFGLSALVVLVNSALALVVLRQGRGRWSPLIPAALAVTAAIAFGGVRLQFGGLTREGTPVRVALVQGNVPQSEKWDPARAERILERYLSMSREGAARGATLLVWPESSLPYYFEEDPRADAIRRLARETGTSILFGSDQVERANPPRFYNSAFLVTPEGTVGGIYRKNHLVPFGEYIPMKRLLFFAAPLVESVSDFSAGDQVTLMPVGGHRLSTAICYEVVYPGLAREAVSRGSELLTTITNDAWYGRSSAPWQHFEQALVRAVEQGRYLVRSANTGVSGVVDPYGRVLARSRLFDQVTVVSEARFLASRTIYGRTGDVFAYACALLVAVALVGGRWRAGR